MNLSLVLSFHCELYRKVNSGRIARGRGMEENKGWL